MFHLRADTRAAKNAPRRPVDLRDAESTIQRRGANRSREQEHFMSSVRVLVGTRKGAFILTADGKRESWEVTGPHFGGWEIYHLKGSPADSNRIDRKSTR